MFWSRNRRRKNLLNRREKRSYNKKSLVILPMIIIIGFIFGLNSQLVQVKNLEIKAKYIDCADEDGLRADIPVKGLNILFLDKDVVKKGLLEKYPCIKEVHVEKKFLNTIQVSVSGRVPVLNVATLYQQDASLSASLDEVLEKIASPSATASDSAVLENILTNDFLVDQNGEVFVSSKKEDLPEILLLSDEIIKVGKRLDKNLIDSLLILFDKLKVFSVDFKEVKVYSQGNILVDGNTSILLNQKYDLQKQLASLQLILEKAKIENEQILFLDVRFEKPVVRYVKKRN